jgi:outer membrane receptor protein involved in Fe transport
LAVATLAIGYTNPARAQTDSSTQVVTVTATKRTQSIQEVPLSVSAISGADLERQGVQRWEDALAGQPAVMVNSSGNVVGNNVVIRGVSDGVSGGNTQSTVALYIDDMPVISTLSQGNPSLLLFDIDQLTVLRGPRSTLYGASSLGGTIKIETLNPSLKSSEGRVRLGVSQPKDGKLWSSEAVASYSTPLSKDVLAVGVMAYRVKNAGYIDHPRLGNDIASVTTSGGRLSLFAKPAVGWTVAAKVYHQETSADAAAYIDNAAGGRPIAPNSAVLESNADKVTAGTLNVRYKTDAFELVSATSAFDKKLYYDTDFTAFFGPPLVAFGVPAGTPLVDRSRMTVRLKSQELRLVSPDAKAGVLWSAGVFYSEEKTRFLGSTPSPLGDLFAPITNFDISQGAVFGELGYKWASGWELTTGLRRAQYKTDSETALAGLFGIPGTNVTRARESVNTPHVSLAYRFDGQMIYGQASKGFRPGRGNVPVLTVPGNTVPAFALADSLWTYEVGAKTSWAANAVSANVAVYTTRWKNPQLTLVQSNGFTYVDSLGIRNPGAGIQVDGVDLEFVVRPVQGTRITGGAGYTDSTFNRDVGGLDPTGVLPKGSRTAGVPKLTANLALKQDLSIMGRGASFDAVLRHVGGYWSDYNSATRQKIGERTTIDLRLSSTLGGTDVAVYVNNLTNEQPKVFYVGPPVNWHTTIAPRTLGVVARAAAVGRARRGPIV